MERFVDAYAVLGVAPDAEQDALKRAHRALVRRHHPDLVPPEERPAATRRVQEVNVAYGLVRDPSARARYDRLRTVHRTRQAATGPVRATAQSVREADRRAGEQWEALLAAAGAWAGRWWDRHRLKVLRGVWRLRRAGTDLLGRVLWLCSCTLWLALGLLVATAGQRLVGVGGVLLPLLGAGTGLVVGHRRGWRRRLRLARIPPESAHRLRGWAEAGVASAVLGAGLLIGSLLR